MTVYYVVSSTDFVIAPLDSPLVVWQHLMKLHCAALWHMILNISFVNVKSRFESLINCFLTQWRQRAWSVYGEKGVQQQPCYCAPAVRPRVSGLLRFLRHSWAALVRSSLSLPARDKGQSPHGPLQHVLPGLRGWPATRLPAHARVSQRLPQWAGGRADQLRHNLLRRSVPASDMGGGAFHRAWDVAPVRTLWRSRAHLYASQALALPLRGTRDLLSYLHPEPLQRVHLSHDGDRCTVRFSFTEASGPCGAGATQMALLFCKEWFGQCSSSGGGLTVAYYRCSDLAVNEERNTLMFDLRSRLG